MNFIIIGGNATGMSAASRLRKNNPQATITVLEQGDLVSFGACGLPYYIGDEFNNPDNMIVRSVEDFQKNNINVLLYHQAKKIDPINKIVIVSDSSTNTTKNISYDKLIISTGAHPLIPNIEGIELPGIYTLTKMKDGILLKEALRTAKKIIIIGGGFIGLEAAEAMIRQEKTVTILERSESISGRVFDSEMTNYLEESIQKDGVQLCLEETVTAFKGNEKIQQVITNKSTYNADLVIIATGFIPTTKWCADIGLNMLPNGAIIIDEYCQTNLPDIYSGGDCATVKHAVSNQNSYIPLATNANKLGRLLGDILTDKKTKFQGTLGSSALRFLDFQIARTGISEHEAKSLGLNYATNFITDYDHTSYVPNQSKLHIKLIYDKETRVILGGQMCGAKGAVLRVDVLAVAILKKMTVDELGMMDLIYSPPFSRTWDILNIAGNTCK
ncbi:MAG: CoA-disulfide reductase [Spirochaetota bacterium]|nr:CoA-disulfide reductase [Spirochaetota bacterium]